MGRRTRCSEGAFCGGEVAQLAGRDAGEGEYDRLVAFHELGQLAKV